MNKAKRYMVKQLYLLFLLLIASNQAFGAPGDPDSVRVTGHMRVNDGIVFSDNSVLTSVNNFIGPQGPKGDTGATGSQGPVGPVCQPTLTAICDAIKVANAVLPAFCLTASATYSQSDISGTWVAISLLTGSVPVWADATFQADASGLVPQHTTTTNAGIGTSSAATLTITSNGSITKSNTPTFRAEMSRSKDFFVGTGLSNGTPSLSIAIKAGGNYSPNDLQGTWRAYWLSLAPPPGSPMWSRADVTVDATNTAIFSNTVRNIVTGNMGPLPLTLSSSGIVSVSGYSSFYGAVSKDKNLFVSHFTGSGAPGCLMIMVRTTGTYYSINSSQGAWRFNSLNPGDGSSLTPFWARGILTEDGFGSGTISNAAWGSAFTEGVLPDSTADKISIASNGIVSLPMAPVIRQFDGIVSLDGNLMVATSSGKNSDGVTNQSSIAEMYFYLK